MFAALALGGPVGTALFSRFGFAAIGWATMLLPLAVASLLVKIPGVLPLKKAARSQIGGVATAVWLPGLGAALSSIGYGAILAFSSLHFTQHGWQPIWLAFASFGAALILGRVFLGHLPDRWGGARVAFAFIFIEAAGLLLIWIAQDAVMASVGAGLAGLGYSLVYPGLGVEAVRDAAPENRGLAIGLYTACLDLALGVGSPVLGFVAGRAGLDAVFLVSALAVVSTAIIAQRLMRGEPSLP